MLYLVLNHAAEEWKRPPREWFEAKTQFAIIFVIRNGLMNETGLAHKITDRPGRVSPHHSADAR
ncbi:nitrous oxide reductase accessory protein NosL [Novosphingobium marinum]|uniref:Nitrous oxide reductase accessory protein NosL n=1 Tax=Novosphingobium marinum TaxID=1514948 RepID=A0A7Z0BVE7_9SPHN|nr:nitrous oxide reductase accessory protein NosL [Novosphingobium marinum]